jgi:signal transduction histidine kinase
MPKDACADQLARELAAAHGELRRAAQVLHDDVGSLLAVAGIRLQLLQLDHPAAGAHTAEVSQALEGVMHHLRTLSRNLEPSTVRRTGLKNALLALADSGMDVEIAVRYRATAIPPPTMADALYHAIEAAVRAAAAGARATRPGRITIAVTGSRALTARVGYPGPPARGRNWAAARLLARHCGIAFDVETTKKGTIVCIRYAI